MKVNALIQKYKNLSLPLKVSVWFFVCSLLQKGLAFLTTPLFTRLLSVDDYGIVSIFYSWEQIVVIFVTLGLANSVFNVGLVHNPDDRDNFQSSMLGISLVSALFFSFLLWAFFPLISPSVQLENKYIAILPILCFFATVLQMWSLRERFEYHYKAMALITLLHTFLGTFIAILLVLDFEDRAWGKVFGASCVTIVIGLFCGLDFIRKSKKLFISKYWKFALKYNIPMIPHFLSGVLLNQLDRIMIQRMCGLAQAGIYTVAYNSAMVVYILNQSLSASYNPWLLQRLKTKNYGNIKKNVNIILLCYSAALSIVILFAPEIMKIMAPIEYQAGIYVIPPVAASMYFILLFNIYAPVEHYSLKTKFIAMASVFATISKIILNIYFIDFLGYLAAGYTTLACYILYAFAHYLYMKRVCRKNLDNINLFDNKFIWILGGTITVFSVVLAFVYEYMLIRYVLILSIALVLVMKKRSIQKTFKEMKK